MTTQQNDTSIVDSISRLSVAERKEARKSATAAKLAEQQAAKEQEEAASDHARNRYGHKANDTFMPLAPKDKYTSIEQIASNPSSYVDKQVTVRAFLHGVRGTARNAFIILRQKMHSMQSVASIDNPELSKPMVKFIGVTSKESLVEITGIVRNAEIKSESMSVRTAEIHVLNFWVINEALLHPFDLDDAARSEDNNTGPRVTLDTRLQHRVFDLRTTTNQAIFRLQHAISRLFREFLEARSFVEIHTPKLISAASEGGANVFKVAYFDKTAFLAQSPQFYKQMMIVAGMERVFEIAPVFRAENSFTHRHMTEFMGLDIEMAFMDNYHEVMLLIAELLLFIFHQLPLRYASELAIVRSQYPIEEFKFTEEPLILTYTQAIELLCSDGVQIGNMDDMGTEQERHLGRLVRQRYNTDFYIIDKFPLALRPFYTMPDSNMPGYANAYDFFMRGEEILSGAQRVHNSNMLEQRAQSLGIDTSGMRDYIESFRYGAPPHAGGGIGLERVLMFYLGLKNIRLSSLFPRDPIRLTP